MQKAETTIIGLSRNAEDARFRSAKPPQNGPLACLRPTALIKRCFATAPLLKTTTEEFQYKTLYREWDVPSILRF